MFGRLRGASGLALEQHRHRVRGVGKVELGYNAYTCTQSRFTAADMQHTAVNVCFSLCLVSLVPIQTTLCGKKNCLQLFWTPPWTFVLSHV